jgi:hypothetical protein
MSLLDALRRLLGGGFQPQHPPRPDLTPEEEAEPRERRHSVDEAKATNGDESAHDDVHE